MIDRVVQRPFLLWQAEAMLDPPPGRPDMPLPEGTEEAAPEDVEAARAAVARAIERERRVPLTPPPAPAGLRGEAAPPIEKRSYFPRDPALSIVQSAVELYLMQHAPVELISAVPEEAADRGDDEVSAIADYTLNIDDEAIPAETSDDRRLGGAFEITDPRWISSVVAMGWRKLRGRRRFLDHPAEPRALADDARVVVVGDWASGNLRARRVRDQMRVAIDAAREAGRECHVVHLGDTYYGGWDYEYETRFLPNWPVQPGEADTIGSWSLPGNHDMYTGGHGYYQVLLSDPRFDQYHRGASWFSLENDHWQLLGLDTAWDDHALKGRQAGWVEEKLNQHPDRRTMLLSHHQPFSRYGGDGPKLKAALANPLASGRIDSWLWGHEHRCVVYEPLEGIGHPRCIGHGGIPVYVSGRKPAGVTWHLDRSFRTGLETWAYCGFAVLDFDGPSIAVDYVNEFGETDFEETI